MSAGQTFVGTIMPSRRAIVGSAVDGRVVTFLVQEGDRVEEGARLAELLTDTISLELEAAEAELEWRKQQQAELENGSRPDEIEQARARMEAASAALTYLAAERVRLEQLISNRAISASEYERVVSLALEGKQKYEEAKAAHQLAVDGPRAEQILQAYAQTAMQDAVVRRLRDQIKKHTIISRFAGYVTAEHTEVGQWVTRGDPVAEVVALDEVDVVAKVVDSQVPYIHVGDSVRVEVPALTHRIIHRQRGGRRASSRRALTHLSRQSDRAESDHGGRGAVVEGRHVSAFDVADRRDPASDAGAQRCARAAREEPHGVDDRRGLDCRGQAGHAPRQCGPVAG